MKELVDLNEKVYDVDRKVDDVKKELRRITEVGVGKGKQSLDNNEDPDIKEVFERSKTIEDLETVLEKIDIKKEPDTGDNVEKYYCDICFDGSKPNWRIKTAVVGVFRLEKTESEDEGNNQSAQFRHFKTHVREHMLSKTHQQKKGD